MMTIAFPRTPLKEMDAASLVFELSRQVEARVFDRKGIVMAAAMMAAHLHRNQTRGIRRDLPRVPYIEHPMRNTLRALRYGKTDPELLAACLMHDTLEDCVDEIVDQFVDTDELPGHIALETISGRRAAAHLWMIDAFGATVADVVLDVSNKVACTRRDYWMKMAALAARATGAVPDPIATMAVIVKALDLLDNAGALRHQLAAGDTPSVVLRRAQKYLPAVKELSPALRFIGEPEIADDLDKLLVHLEEIIASQRVSG
ncbi:hypothetical protein OVA26_16715 [Microbacterium sp. SL62]|uniref:hypothetical protein n=1 Tax=Microbacterium sp. SL62 TaxID=2995139 RepID=UPI0022739973|nr:hypothetical protein [Microbacterium sp. SL62]MCY1718581.1 hypothetical protein [Microbacterium sp. SL62]